MKENSESSAARIIGWGLLAMAVLAGMAYGALHPQFAQAPSPTLAIREMGGLFLVELGLWWGVLLLDLAISLAFFTYFQVRNRTFAWTVALSRGAYTLMLGAALVFLTAAYDHPEDATEALRTFESLWSQGLVVFGIHLMLAGVGGWVTGKIPRWISVLLLLAGLCYFLTHGLASFGGNWEDLSRLLESWTAPVMMTGEMALAIWMVARSFRPSGSDTTAS